MKRIFSYLALLILFVVLAAGALMLVPPTGYAKKAAIERVRTATGLDLKINGPLSMRLFPSLSLRIEDVALVNSAVAPDKAVIAARAIEVQSPIWPLITGDRRIERVVLTEPRADLDIDKNGRANWLAPVATRSRPGAADAEFSVATLVLSNGIVAYRDQRSGQATQFNRTEAVVRDVRADRFAQAVINAATATSSETSSNSSIEVTDLVATLNDFEGMRVREISGTGSVLKWQQAQQGPGLDAQKFAAKAQSVGLDAIGAIAFDGATVTWREPAGGSSINARDLAITAKGIKGGRLDDVTLKSSAVTHAQTDGSTINATTVAASAKSVAADRLEGVAATSTRFTYEAAKRSPGASAAAAPAIALEQPSFAAPVIATRTPVEADVGFVWNKERVAGKVRLPTPDAIASGPTFPTSFALAAVGSSVDFDGNVSTADGGLKGTAKATTGSVETLAAWLGVTVPATVRGTASLAGAIDAQPTRFVLTNGRIQHGINTLTGSLAIDHSARPKVTGKLAADKLDADAYLGLTPAKPKPAQQAGPRPETAPRPEVVEPEVPLSDVFKSYMRAIIAAPVTRSGTLEIPNLSVDDLIPAAKRAKPKPGEFAWSDEKFDVSALRSVDLDVDWSVKQLAVRGIEFNVPQLKTQLTGGNLSLEGRDIGTKDGRVSGKAQVDARQNVPTMTASLKGEGIDLRELSEALGMTPMIEGATSVDANVSSSGNSQKQLIEGLSGRVQTNMPRGNVLGYDLGNINLSTIIRWLTGNREFDPERRTPVTGLKADLNIDKGVVRESQVEMGGPFLGVNAEGTIRLVEQRLDYNGRARIASFFTGLQFKLFGDLTRPTFQPDVSLASVFSRAPPGDPTIIDMLGSENLRDPELVDLIGRVLAKAGPSGLDPAFATGLRTLQQKARGGP